MVYLYKVIYMSVTYVDLIKMSQVHVKRLSNYIRQSIVQFFEKNRVIKGSKLQINLWKIKTLRNINYSNEHNQPKNSAMLKTSFGCSLSHLQSRFHPSSEILKIVWVLEINKFQIRTNLIYVIKKLTHHTFVAKMNENNFQAY